MHANAKRTNKGMKYNKRNVPVEHTRLARCGHASKIERYFNCETCQPLLESDDGELVYHQSESDSWDKLENDCE